jgi:hypothetical protein
MTYFPGQGSYGRADSVRRFNVGRLLVILSNRPASKRSVRSNWSMSLSPGSSGPRLNNSPSMAPTDQTSTASQGLALVDSSAFTEVALSLEPSIT